MVMKGKWGILVAGLLFAGSLHNLAIAETRGQLAKNNEPTRQERLAYGVAPAVRGALIVFELPTAESIAVNADGSISLLGSDGGEVAEASPY